MATVRETVQSRINNLTLAEVKDYIGTADPLMWIEYNVLDVVDLGRKYGALAEDMLDETIEDMKWN